MSDHITLTQEAEDDNRETIVKNESLEEISIPGEIKELIEALPGDSLLYF